MNEPSQQDSLSGGRQHYEPKLPCDATQIRRLRTAIGEAGVEEILKATIDVAADSRAVTPEGFQRVIVDTTVQEKVVAFPTESRLLEIARAKVSAAARQAGFALKKTFVHEGAILQRRASGYAHARQYRRLKRVLRRQHSATTGRDRRQPPSTLACFG